jgi:23S rRNA (adenine2030-N6)-methyltransferase
MNYHHIYHAGNFADVFKHFILCLCLEKLQEKENPFFVIDTHGGIGKYDLTTEIAGKTAEYEDGILKLFSNQTIHSLFENYLNIVRNFNKLHENEIRIYPGSPLIIKQFLRKQDKAIFAELHQEDFILLKRNFAGDRQIKTLNQDGYLLLKSQLPNLIKRGLILIDPPFEKGNGKEDDFTQIIKYLEEGYKRFATGIYLIWYPIVNEKLINNFYKKIKELKLSKTLISEIIIDQKIEDGFKGCGMIIINAPWQSEEKLSQALPLLLKYLQKPEGKFKIENYNF